MITSFQIGSVRLPIPALALRLHLGDDLRGRQGGRFAGGRAMRLPADVIAGLLLFENLLPARGCGRLALDFLCRCKPLHLVADSLEGLRKRLAGTDPAVSPGSRSRLCLSLTSDLD